MKEFVDEKIVRKSFTFRSVVDISDATAQGLWITLQERKAGAELVRCLHTLLAPSALSSTFESGTCGQKKAPTVISSYFLSQTTESCACCHGDYT
ncbi:hypothetical protein C1H46_024472 [Malus baccata]|uniref:Uncharacterized protein n=1 Tax=Malus baccata TaxID=106549 RepID=A0A540LUC8_MALBA|nr:hypothetical protein C1H46_024472 [Malus baccata]